MGNTETDSVEEILLPSVNKYKVTFEMSSTEEIQLSEVKRDVIKNVLNLEFPPDKSNKYVIEDIHVENLNCPSQ